MLRDLSEMTSKNCPKKYKFIEKLNQNLPIQTHDFERVLNFQKHYKSQVKFIFIFNRPRDYFRQNYQWRRKNTKIYPKKTLKTRLLSALKFEKLADKKARFECNEIWKMSKKRGKSKNHNYYMSKKSKKDSIITSNCFKIRKSGR